MDWRDLKRTDRIIVQQLNPSGLDSVIGELDGVDLSGGSIDAAYYSDTRTSGKLDVIGDGWQRGSFIRIIHEVPEWGYSNELGTYIVTDDGAERENGIWRYSLTLQSMLYALDLDRLVKPWTIAKNAMAMTAAQQILAQTAFESVFSGNDYKVKSAQVLESGTSRLSALFSLCQMASNRIDVDGHGRIQVKRYETPASKSPVWRIDLADTRGIALDGLSRSTDWLELPDTVAVAHKYSDTAGSKTVEREINAVARVGSGSQHSAAVRGYSIVDFRDVSEMSPRTAARAQQLANAYLVNDSRELVEWELTTTYLPIWEGDVVELVVHDGDINYQGARKCLVKSISLDLAPLRMKLTLKETASGDEDA